MSRKASTSGRRTVCVLSSHPLVLRQIEQVLASDRYLLRTQRIETSPVHELGCPSRAPLYVVDTQLPRPTAETVIGSIARRFPKARIVVVGDSFGEEDAFALLRLGVKGLVPYSELRRKLPLALDIVADGGFWAPRALLSRFLDTLVAPSKGRPRSGLSAAISGREREVLEFLLSNLSNKEIADRLHISERTVKFHVSNLLAKFRLTRRQELILHCLGLGVSGERRRPLARASGD